MLFLHGFGCSQAMWRHVAPAFTASHRVVCIDQIGAGGADSTAYDSARHGTLHGYAHDLVEVCRALGPTPVTVVGHSVGGTIAMLAAIEAPECFEQLVLVAPSPCYTNHPPDYEGGFDRQQLEDLLDLMDRNSLAWASALAATVMQNPERPELAEELRRSLCALDPNIARDFARVTFLSDHRADLCRVCVPAVILQCQGDPLAPLSVGDVLHRELVGSRLVHLQATGHCPHVSHPAEAIAVISAALMPHAAHPPIATESA